MALLTYPGPYSITRVCRRLLYSIPTANRAFIIPRIIPQKRLADAAGPSNLPGELTALPGREIGVYVGGVI